MDEIRVGMIAPVQNYQQQRDGSRRAPSPRKGTIKDRRKHPSDRRKSVRQGIVVTLSDQEDRRDNEDRRKK